MIENDNLILDIVDIEVNDNDVVDIDIDNDDIIDVESAEKIDVYVPVATTSVKGIASFWNEHFQVIRGSVKLLPKYADEPQRAQEAEALKVNITEENSQYIRTIDKVGTILIRHKTVDGNLSGSYDKISSEGYESFDVNSNRIVRKVKDGMNLVFEDIDYSTNIGSRIILTESEAYYTKGKSNRNYTESEEIIQENIVRELIQNISLYQPYELELPNGTIINGLIYHGDNVPTDINVASYDEASELITIYLNGVAQEPVYFADKKYRHTITATINGQTQDYYIAANSKWEPLGLDASVFYTKIELDDFLSIMQSDINKRYIKPSTGIPSTDIGDGSIIQSKLSSEVKEDINNRVNTTINDPLDLNLQQNVRDQINVYSKEEVDDEFSIRDDSFDNNIVKIINRERVIWSSSTTINITSNYDNKTQIINLTNISAINTTDKVSPVSGDLVFDKYGNLATVLSLSGSDVTLNITQSSLQRAIKYPDGSWELYQNSSDVTQPSGKWSWNFSTSMLRFQGSNINPKDPIQYEQYSIIAGNVNFDYSNPGTQYGARYIVAFESGESVDGVNDGWHTDGVENIPSTLGAIRLYITDGRNDNLYTAADRVANKGSIDDLNSRKAENQLWIYNGVISGVIGDNVNTIRSSYEPISVKSMEIGDTVFASDNGSFSIITQISGSTVSVRIVSFFNTITGITLESTVGLTKTYRITLNSGAYVDIPVTDGVSITSITGPSTSVLVDTYTINYNNGTKSTYTVTNGKGIESIVLKSTSANGLTDTYTIKYNDNTTQDYTVKHGNYIISTTKTTSGLVDTYTQNFKDGSTFVYTVTNAKSINGIIKTDTTGLVDTYTISFNDSTTQNYTVTNGKGIVSIAKSGSVAGVDTYTITYNDSTTSTFTVQNSIGELAVEEIYNALESIQETIPTLATQDFVNSSIQGMSAFPVFKDANQANFSTKDEFLAVVTSGTMYRRDGSIVSNYQNCYTIIISDESAPAPFTNGQVRYAWESNDIRSYYYDFGINETPFTSAQQNSINSGATSALIAQISSNATAISGKAPINSPTFTGTPKSVTFTSTDNSTNIATTAFVHSITDNIQVTDIQKSQLSTAVQTSLGKADTALQSFTETDPTVPSWAKAAMKPSYAASEVGLGNVTNNKQLISPTSAVGQQSAASPAFGGTFKVVGVAANGQNLVEQIITLPTPSYPSVPTAYTSNPAELAVTASPGSSINWSRGDHVHAKPTYSASEVGAEPAFTKNTAFNKNFGSGASDVCVGNDSRLSDSRPASDVYAWAKASTKPSYTAGEITSGIFDIARIPTGTSAAQVSLGNHTHSYQTRVGTAYTAGTQLMTAPATVGTAPGVLAVSTFVRTSGNQSISGIKTFTTQLNIVNWSITQNANGDLSFN